MKLHLKQSRGNNSESMKVRVAILVHNTLSRPVLHICKVSCYIPKGFQVMNGHEIASETNKGK